MRTHSRRGRNQRFLGNTCLGFSGQPWVESPPRDVPRETKSGKLFSIRAAPDGLAKNMTAGRGYPGSPADLSAAIPIMFFLF
jgi:hypothetical protein